MSDSGRNMKVPTGEVPRLPGRFLFRCCQAAESRVVTVYPEVFQFSDVLAGLADAVGVPIVPVRAGVVVAGVGVADQNPGDLQDAAGYCDDGLRVRGVSSDAPVARVQERSPRSSR